MKAIKGPAVFLAQFAGDAPPFNSLPTIADWAAQLGFKGVQIPTWDRRLFDLEKAAESQTYCDEVRGVLAGRGLQVTELSTHLQGQLVAVHPAYDTAFDGFAAPQVRGKPQARAAWAVEQLDYLEYIDLYHERIRMFHVKDAEFNPTGRQGVYGGFQSWIDRAGRFRSLGDGQVNFKAIFSKLTQYDYPGWAVLEWECCLKHPEDGAREGATFIADHIIRVTDKAFDDFAGAGADVAANRRMLGVA